MELYRIKANIFLPVIPKNESVSVCFRYTKKFVAIDICNRRSRRKYKLNSARVGLKQKRNKSRICNVVKCIEGYFTKKEKDVGDQHDYHWYVMSGMRSVHMLLTDSICAVCITTGTTSQKKVMPLKSS